MRRPINWWEITTGTEQASDEKFVWGKSACQTWGEKYFLLRCSTPRGSQTLCAWTLQRRCQGKRPSAPTSSLASRTAELAYLGEASHTSSWWPCFWSLGPTLAAEHSGMVTRPWRDDSDPYKSINQAGNLGGVHAYGIEPCTRDIWSPGLPRILAWRAISCIGPVSGQFFLWTSG